MQSELQRQSAAAAAQVQADQRTAFDPLQELLPAVLAGGLVGAVAGLAAIHLLLLAELAFLGQSVGYGALAVVQSAFATALGGACYGAAQASARRWGYRRTVALALPFGVGVFLASGYLPLALEHRDPSLAIRLLWEQIAQELVAPGQLARLSLAQLSGYLWLFLPLGWARLRGWSRPGLLALSLVSIFCWLPGLELLGVLRVHTSPSYAIGYGVLIFSFVYLFEPATRDSRRGLNRLGLLESDD